MNMDDFDGIIHVDVLWMSVQWQGEMVVQSRRRFLRQCALATSAWVSAACARPAPSAPTFFATPAAQVELPTLTPRTTAQPTRTPQVVIPTSVVFPPPPAPGAPSFADAGGLRALQTDAEREGVLHIIGMPRDWLKYGQIIDLFQRKYAVSVVELYPEYGSRDVAEYLKTSVLDTNLMVPDVVELGATYGASLKTQNFLQPYRPEHWNDIPVDIKDQDAYWYGTYYGIMSFAVNRSMVANPPQTWADLSNEEYRGYIGLTGMPTDSLQSFYAVLAASLAAAPTGLDDIRFGIETMRSLRDMGNLVSFSATHETFLRTQPSIMPIWSYLGLSLRDFALGNPAVDVVIPAQPLGSPFIHAINAYAPHSAAARLWIEHLYSAEVQTIWLESYAVPARFSALNRVRTFSNQLLAKFPSPKLLDACSFANVNQILNASAVLNDQWRNIVDEG